MEEREKGFPRRSYIDILIHKLFYDPLHHFMASKTVLKTDSLHINYAWVSPAEEQVSFHVWLILQHLIFTHQAARS